MILGKKFTNLLLIILDTILYVKLHRLIGLMSAKVVGEAVLGIKATKEEVVPRGNGDPLKKPYTAWATSAAKISQQEVKNFPV